MVVKDIKQICLTGSKTYYQYLSSKRNGGVEEVEISKIDKINSETYKVKVTKKLFDVESVCFRYNGIINKTFTTEDIQVKVYDNNKRVVVIRVSREVQKYISDLKHSQWKLVVDLKFLVQRVIDWYDSNGNDLKLQSGKVKNNHFDQSVLFQEDGFQPSPEQKRAIEMVFSNYFSYVWGAPGTGKTRFVLSYSILSYIKKELKVLVLAPTNVALEQVISGVLEMTDKAGLDRNSILRLGFPSQEFANRFGEICEIQGLEKELKRVNNQINIISSILGIQNDKEIEIRNHIELLESLSSLQLKAEALKKELNSLEATVKSIETSLREQRSQLKTLEFEKKDLIKKKNSTLGKVFSFLSSKVDYDSEISRVTQREHHIEVQIAANEPLLDQKLSVKKQTEVELGLIKKQAVNKMELLEELGVIEDRAKVNLKNTIVELKENLQKELDDQQVFKSLSNEYETLDQSELSDLLYHLKSQKEKLENYSLDSRVENALVIGATIDTYLHRFKDKRVDFAHIFIDEAGYASIVKALTVFTSKNPVTFLGDHKQLPPVCELSKKEIRKNEDFREVFVWDQSAIFTGDFWNSNNLNAAIDIYLNSQTPNSQYLPKSSLTESFRFGPNLASVLDKYVYEEGFSSQIDEDTEIILCNVANPQVSRGRGRLNEAEALAIQHYVQDQFTVNDSLSILAPYRDQIKELKKLLPEFKDENKILTVHKSQGREWETVIYSVCDIGNGRKPWFTDSQSIISNGLNNINTAVSRAKKRLIIFCCINEWIGKNDQLITGLINACTHRINYDSSQFTYSVRTSQRKQIYRKTSIRKPTHTNQNIAQNSKIKSKDYVPSKANEEWESRILYWSKLKKPGYTYSRKKDAWWKKK